MKIRPKRQKRLLVCSIYWGAAGHQVIALQVADWFRAADPDLYIAALVPATHAELAPLVPALDEIISIDVSAMVPLPDDVLAHVSADWDYVVTPLSVSGTTETLETFYELLRGHVSDDSVFGTPRAPGMPPMVSRPLRLRIPSPVLESAAGRVGSDRPAVAVIPGSGTGNGARTPSTRFWVELVDALLKMPTAPRVVLIGLTGSPTLGRTKGFGRHEIEAVQRGRDDVIDAFDLPMTSQLALAAQCSALVAPHSGFCFAVQAVGVPWVVLSGGEHHEYWANGVPIVPIYPDCPRYPCSGRRLPECDELATGDFHGQFPCLADAALLPRMDRIVAAVDDVFSKRIDYGQAIVAHSDWLRAQGVGIRDLSAVRSPNYRF